MIAFEHGVRNNSHLYFHTASIQAQKTFFYPLCIGHFFCDSKYRVTRNNFNSFLIMIIKKGSGFVVLDDKPLPVTKGQIVLLDCYKPHGYYTDTGWESLWLHFDGIAAREYYNMISSNWGNILSLKDIFSFEKHFNKIYDIFHGSLTLKEALISKYITNMLTECFLSSQSPADEAGRADIIEETITYINEHIGEELSLEILAGRVCLSPYYFLRVFQKETGFTPHQYIILTRINSAKFFLKTSAASVKEIAFRCGFKSESSFCTTFKKWVTVTPSDYRNMRVSQKS